VLIKQKIYSDKASIRSLRRSPKYIKGQAYNYKNKKSAKVIILTKKTKRAMRAKACFYLA